MTGLQRKLFRDLKRMGFQVVTIAVLILGGLSVLVSSWSSFQSLQKARDDFYQQFRFADVFADLVRAPESLSIEIAKIAGVERVETRIVKDGLIDVPGQVEPAMGRFISWRGDTQTINLIHLRQGRMPRAHTDPEVVVHEAFASKHHLRSGDRLKVLMAGRQKTFVITGIGLSPEFVYALSPMIALPDDKHFGIFWMRQQDLESLAGMSGAFNSVQVKLSDTGQTEEVKRQLDMILRPFGNVQAFDRSKQLSNLFVEDEIRQQRVMAMIVPAVFLAVAIFILNIILSRLIDLHRPQIATLKSLGYSDWSLTGHYFQLVTIVLLVGIIPSIFIGAWIGRWYAQLYQDFFRFPSIDFNLSVSAVVICFLAGLVPGWLGAARALVRVFGLNPAEALRPPSPPRFHKGFLERWGFFANMNNFSKIIFRSLFFRPVRLVMNIVGMSLALAILINGSFWTDVINAVMSRQFHEMRREDLTVRLMHPKSVSVVSELSRLPGVIMLEGERTVAVRLQFKNFKKDIALMGWQKEAQLSRVLDEDGNLIKPIPGALLLSRYFETEAGLRAGDRVSLKVLSGEQRQFFAVVGGFVDDMIGQQAYVLKEDLHNWLQEKPAFDTIQMKVEPRYIEKIYLALKQKPEVAGINIRSLLLRSFTETVANMIITFTFILFVFAIALAGAVIYNSARIVFSERSWELASLRILGFEMRRTFELLFFDIGLQVLLSLGPGLLLGFWLSYFVTSMIHNETFKFPLVIEWSTYAGAVFTLLMTFLASGIFLYFKVRRLDFSEALKARE